MDLKRGRWSPKEGSQKLKFGVKIFWGGQKCGGEYLFWGRSKYREAQAQLKNVSKVGSKRTWSMQRWICDCIFELACRSEQSKENDNGAPKWRRNRWSKKKVCRNLDNAWATMYPLSNLMTLISNMLTKSSFAWWLVKICQVQIWWWSDLSGLLWAPG